LSKAEKEFEMAFDHKKILRTFIAKQNISLKNKNKDLQKETK